MRECEYVRIYIYIYMYNLCTKCTKLSKQNELSNMRTELYICMYLDARLYRPVGGWTFFFLFHFSFLFLLLFKFCLSEFVYVCVCFIVFFNSLKTKVFSMLLLTQYFLDQSNIKKKKKK